MEISIEIKEVYGQQRFYPACEISRNLLKLTGKKTFTKDVLKTIQELDYSIKIMTPEIDGTFQRRLA